MSILHTLKRKLRSCRRLQDAVLGKCDARKDAPKFEFSQCKIGNARFDIPRAMSSERLIDRTCEALLPEFDKIIQDRRRRREQDQQLDHGKAPPPVSEGCQKLPPSGPVCLRLDLRIVLSIDAQPAQPCSGNVPK